MPTRHVELVKTEYRLITNKQNFIARVVDGFAVVRTDTAVPAAGAVGMPLDPSKGLPRQFDGNLYGKAVGDTAEIVVLESDA
jgi:hypothetical protein